MWRNVSKQWSNARVSKCLKFIQAKVLKYAKVKSCNNISGLFFVWVSAIVYMSEFLKNSGNIRLDEPLVRGSS